MILTPIYISAPVNQGRKHHKEPRQEQKNRVEQEKNTETRNKNTVLLVNNPHNYRIQRINRTDTHIKTVHAILKDFSGLFRSK